MDAKFLKTIFRVKKSLHSGKMFMPFCHLLIFLEILTGIPSVLNSLDPDQAHRFVRPDLGTNCLENLLANDTRRLRVKGGFCPYPIRTTPVTFIDKFILI